MFCEGGYWDFSCLGKRKISLCDKDVGEGGGGRKSTRRQMPFMFGGWGITRMWTW